jgi:hypothetical protein
MAGKEVKTRRADGTEEIESVVDLIERMFGPDRPPLTSIPSTLLKQFGALTIQDRARVEGYIAALAEKRGDERRSSERTRFQAKDRKSTRSRSTPPA